MSTGRIRTRSSRLRNRRRRDRDLRAGTRIATLPPRYDALPQRFDHGRQTIAAQVRAMLVENLGLPFALGKKLQNALHLGSAARQVSLPSLNVPAPPSPNR